MEDIGGLILPLKESPDSGIRLIGARFRLANYHESCIISLADHRVQSLECTPVSPNKFVANTADDALTPLLISIPSNLTHLDITIESKKRADPFDLLLLVTRQADHKEKPEAYSEGLHSNNTSSSRFSISSSTDDLRKYSITIHLPTSNLTSGILNLSAQGPIGSGRPLFSFCVWIDETCLLEPPPSLLHDPLTDELPSIEVFPNTELEYGNQNGRLAAPSTDTQSTDASQANDGLRTLAFEQNCPTDSDFTTMLINFAREFRFNITDGPEFRDDLRMLEAKAPQFLNYSNALLDSLLALQTYLRRLVREKSRLVLCIRRVMNLRLGSLVDNENFYEKFERHLDDIVLPFKRQIDHFIHHVCDPNLVHKISSNYMLIPTETATPNTSSTNRLASDNTQSASSKGNTQPARSQSSAAESSGSAVIEIIRARKQFDAACKSFYLWVGRYLANEKDRPPEKLLAKRKAYELAKFDYLNVLDLVTNNQYTNHLLESLFEFVQPPSSKEILGPVDKRAEDEKHAHNPLQPNQSALFSILMQYNSGKYQFRQRIQAAQTNHDLSEALLQGQAKLAFARCISPPESCFHGQDFDRFLLGATNSESFQVQTPEVPCKSGILHVLGGKGKQGWHKEWVTLRNGQLAEYSDWREGKLLVLKPIEVALASIKPVAIEKRQHCFEVFTSQGQRRVFQALSEDERSSWLSTFYRAGQQVDHTRLGNVPHNDAKRPERKLHISTSLEKPQALHTQEIMLPLAIQKIPLVLDNTRSDCYSIVSTIPNAANQICVDCGLLEGVEWIALNHLVSFCVSCASCHRNLGSHVSVVRSLRLDSFEDESRILLRHVNNARANSILEVGLKTAKPAPNASHEERMLFIKEKYKSKDSLSDEMQGNANNELVGGIQQLDISVMMKSIFHGASLNTRVTITTPKEERKVVVPVFEYLLRKYVEADEGGRQRKYFVASELMILNGCDVSRVLADNPLLNISSEGKAYWQKRRTKLGYDSEEKPQAKKIGLVG